MDRKTAGKDKKEERCTSTSDMAGAISSSMPHVRSLPPHQDPLPDLRSSTPKRYCSIHAHTDSIRLHISQTACFALTMKSLSTNAVYFAHAYWLVKESRTQYVHCLRRLDKAASVNYE